MKQKHMENRQEVRITFSKGGDMIYISHRDLASLLERAMRRAGIKIAFSEGFNPRPKISFPSALATGVSSDCEVIFVKLRHPCDTTSLCRDLQEQLPGGITIHAVESADESMPRRMVAARYAVDLPRGVSLERKTLDHALAEGIVQRERTGKRVPLSRYVLGIDVRPGKIEMEICTDNEGSLRPDEVLKAVGIADPLACGIRRTDLVLADREEQRGEDYGDKCPRTGGEPGSDTGRGRPGRASHRESIAGTGSREHL